MVKRILLTLASKYPLAQRFKSFYQQVRDDNYKRQKVDDRLIVFEAFRSTKYADSPKAIYKYMLSAPEYRDYKFIWVFEEPDKYRHHLKNNRTRVVKHESHAHYMAFARAKYWVVNGWLPLRFTKKSEQVMLQCWHGTPLKRLRNDIVDTANTSHREVALRDNDLDAERFDYFISPSKFATKAFTSAFNLKALGREDIIIETGYPRNDFLVNTTFQQIKRLRKQYNIPEDKKVLLYAPTWRDDQHVENKGYFYKSPVDFRYLKEKLDDEYVLLFRAHNLIGNTFDFDAYDGFVRDVSSVDDVNELYVISDVLMTDYSSVFFDYANLSRPIIFFMYDLDHYQDELRGFCIDLKQLPGSIVKTEIGIIDILNDLKTYNEKYADAYQTFHDTYNYLDDGRATIRVVEKIFR